MQSRRIETEYRLASLRNNTYISRITSFTSTNSRCGLPLLKSCRMCPMISAARFASFTILNAASRASSTSGCSRANQRTHVLAFVIAAAVALLAAIFWLTPTLPARDLTSQSSSDRYLELSYDVCAGVLLDLNELGTTVSALRSA